MKIVHIAPNAPYNDYWGYHENLLPKYHKKLGHDVTLIVTNRMHQDGRIIETDSDDYFLSDGIRVIRLKRKKYFHRVITNLNSKLLVFDYLKELKPDFVFFHGLLSTTIFEVIKYKKSINPNCVIVQDNHLDYNIGSKCETLLEKIFRVFYRIINHRSIPYISRVYGVTPWRKTYAEDYFGIPSKKTEVLIMGADDEKINFKERDDIRRRIREDYDIEDDEFLIVTGGKIDKRKKIHFLMDAVSEMNKTKLLIFGQISDEIKEDFERLISESNNIMYIGWIAADKVYDYFFASDLVFFPGQHSVMWEQACAAKVPCVFEKWEGMEHVNNGGNSDFVSDISKESIAAKIEELHFTDKYYKMKDIAMSEKTDIYLYSKVAEKSLECVFNE